ncbi:1,2-phenylacetyl-CoA epoxidase subunit PaaD [Tenggerimyces flavus]|uniref:1,2-phenylacetyl-CoA epoxidase subunit PaaD n=1 Tax=Tenggerimyces flavus TaxID=1708749 RepID=A0ABV7YHE9_9ACTN|nr:1,2-phenylacetyl-CoA epoxidase subunit PaaD [Tenggerimyces flavus]MBM7784003.1 ring-1,2-phenylacetyl-CoA epoxidase subunit PaaD [Tenggerimyces flavus]
MSALTVAETVVDPELPMLTLADLGVLRSVDESAEGVVVTLTPTYLGCPALETMRADLVRALASAGYADVEVRTALHPAWSSDWISPAGKAKLAEAGIAPPGPAPRGPIPLTLTAPASNVACPRCASTRTEILSEFGSTACKALVRCRDCGEPFERVKEI